MGASTSRVTPRPVMPAVKPTWLEVLPSGPRPALARIRESLIRFEADHVVADGRPKGRKKPVGASQ